MPFEIVRNDITKMKVDAIVNSANPHIRIGDGVDCAIHTAAGPRLFEERKKIGKILRGQAVVTPAFKLKAKYVIHTVGPSWR
ncbi:MAG: macro domain-containing protein, partial [Bacilli bacterium]